MFIEIIIMTRDVKHLYSVDVPFTLAPVVAFEDVLSMTFEVPLPV